MDGNQPENNGQEKKYTLEDFKPTEKQCSAAANIFKNLTRQQASLFLTSMKAVLESNIEYSQKKKAEKLAAEQGTSPSSVPSTVPAPTVATPPAQ